MSAKLQTVLAASFAGVAGFVNWLATVPPERQTGWLDTLVELTPVEHRPNVALFSRFVMLFLGVFATYKASQTTPAKL